ncbi:MAG TPA: hypothetical protein VFU27_07175 [Terriglobales bacterium]|nr:hypothetical protein [Terriglobales bacterium]
MKRIQAPIIGLCACLLLGMAAAQNQSQDMSNMPGMDPGGDHAVQAMESRHMDMGPHMKMTALRSVRPGDRERANEIVEQARNAVAKYQDYRVALDEGYRIFLPNVPQKMYHFTNRRYALEAMFHFNPEHPTSLLYEKHGDDYKLIGLMYTAPRRMSEDELDKRIPLSIAEWHQHVNLCLPPMDRRGEMLEPNPQFGLRGSISTKDACEAAGGRFIPHVFGWMVHMYPYERSEQAIWSVERQMHNHAAE